MGLAMFNISNFSVRYFQCNGTKHFFGITGVIAMEHFQNRLQYALYTFKLPPVTLG